MAQRDYYDVLGVGRKATDEEIRSAYRRQARKYHPDLNPGNPQAEHQFKELGQAYEVLSDSQKRAAYDQFGPDGVRMGAGAGPGGPGGPGAGAPSGQRYTWTGESPFDDAAFEAFGGSGGQGSLFEELLGRMGGGQGRRPGRGRKGPAPGKDIDSEIRISFDQAVQGVETTLTFERPMGGALDRPERLSVKIPAGVRDGQRVRLRSQGMPGAGGGPAGDLYLTVRVAPHDLFRREGDDVYMDLPIAMSEAALGAAVEVPTVRGRTRVRIPPGTVSGTKLRLKGQGAGSPTRSSRGDQYCVIKIVPPKKLDERGRRLFEQLRDLPEESPRRGPLWDIP
jgi:DnaJ-class molecular chaperone